MFEIKVLDNSFGAEFCALSESVYNNLENKEWYIPMSQENMKTALENKLFTVVGAVKNGTLAGVSLIDRTADEFAQLSEVAGVGMDKKGAELGACMVLPEYRGNNLMHLMNVELVKLARQSGIEYLVATAHPDNIASNKSLVKLGFELQAEIIRDGHYLRNSYYMEI